MEERSISSLTNYATRESEGAGGGGKCVKGGEKEV